MKEAIIMYMSCDSLLKKLLPKSAYAINKTIAPMIPVIIPTDDASVTSLVTDILYDNKIQQTKIIYNLYITKFTNIIWSHNNYIINRVHHFLNIQSVD